MKQAWATLALTILLTGCMVLPMPILVQDQQSVVQPTTDRLDRYVILEDESDGRLQPLVIEGLRGEQGNFLLHMVLKPIEEIKDASVALTCFGEQDKVLCSHSILLHLDPDGNFAVLREIDVPFEQVHWFRVYWQGHK
jgi:hypothetical protein